MRFLYINGAVLVLCVLSVNGHGFGLGLAHGLLKKLSSFVTKHSEPKFQDHGVEVLKPFHSHDLGGGHNVPAFEHFGNHLGHTVEYVGDHIGHTIKHVGDHAGHTIKHVGEHVGHTIEHVGNHVEHKIGHLGYHHVPKVEQYYYVPKVEHHEPFVIRPENHIHDKHAYDHVHKEHNQYQVEHHGNNGHFDYYGEGYPEHHNHNNDKYEFKYGVDDPKTGDFKSHWEARDGDKVKGVYSVKDADGTKRIVKYSADKKKGFEATVHKIGHEHQVHITHPQPEEHHTNSHGHASSYIYVKN